MLLAHSLFALSLARSLERAGGNNRCNVAHKATDLALAKSKIIIFHGDKDPCVVCFACGYYTVYYSKK